MDEILLIGRIADAIYGRHDISHDRVMSGLAKANAASQKARRLLSPNFSVEVILQDGRRVPWTEEMSEDRGRR